MAPRLKPRHFLVLLLSLVSACGRENPKQDPASLGNLSPLGGQVAIQVHSSIPADQVATLQNDFATLSGAMPEGMLQNTSGEISQRMGVPPVMSSLLGWINQRMKIIVGQNFSYSAFHEVKHGFSYQPHDDFSDHFEKTTLMTNMGALLYGLGRDHQTIYGVDLGGTNPLLVNSPRVGLVQVGEGLFGDLTGPPESKMGQSFARIAVLFHEARHDDGNGMNAGFPHVECESGDFAGIKQCDQATNGPYAVEAAVLGLWIDNCQGCTDGDRDVMRLYRADAISRLLPSSSAQDPTPEKIEIP